MLTRRERTPLRKLMFLGAMAGAGALVEDTATGNPLTFITDKAKPLKSLLIPFTPQQEGSGDPSPENIRSILPWNGLSVVSLDENLLVINRTSAQATQGMTYTPIKQNNVPVAVKVEGTRTNNDPFFNLNHTTKPGGGAGISIPPGTYKIFGGTPEVRVQVFYHDANGKETLAGYCDGSAVTVTIPDDCTASWCRLLTWVDTPVDTVIYPIIASVDSVITETNVVFPSPVYGGTLDVVSGVLTVQRVSISKKWSEWESQSVGNTHTRKISNFDVPVKGASTYAWSRCNVAPQDWNTTQNTHFYIDENKAYVWLPNETDGDLVVQVAGVLVTPQEIQLTPAQITALIGNNSIWSDADGSMTAVYLKKG